MQLQPRAKGLPSQWCLLVSLLRTPRLFSLPLKLMFQLVWEKGRKSKGQDKVESRIAFQIFLDSLARDPTNMYHQRDTFQESPHSSETTNLRFWSERKIWEHSPGNYNVTYPYPGRDRNYKKDIRAVTTPVTAPMVKEPLNIPRKMPTDLKKAAASKACVFNPAGW